MSRISRRMNDVVKVKKENLADLLTCRVCKGLYSEATTIIECLHTFCRKCIVGKIEGVEFSSCPVCGIALGSSGLLKLRPDHNLQELRKKLFPVAIEQSGSSDAVAPTPSPKPKVRSLSSLGVPSPQSSSSGARKDLKAKTSDAEKPALSLTVKGLKESEDSSKKNSSLARASLKGKEKKYTEESSEKQAVPGSGEESNAGDSEGRGEQLKRSKRLVEAAKKKAANNNKDDSQDSSDNADNSVSLAELIGNMAVSKAGKKKKRGKRSKPNGIGKGPGGSQSGPARAAETTQGKPAETTQGKQAETTDRPTVASGVQAPGGLVQQQIGESFEPVWFSLVASTHPPEGYQPLAQIPSRYLRVKEGNMQVSMVKKYIAKKLAMSEDIEIELMMRDQAVPSSMTLLNMVEMWVATLPSSEKITATAGSSAADIVMLLNYCRKP